VIIPACPLRLAVVEGIPATEIGKEGILYVSKGVLLRGIYGGCLNAAGMGLTSHGRDALVVVLACSELLLKASKYGVASVSS